MTVTAMGDTRRYAERVRLIEMTPRADLSSTRYALVNPGQEYLVLQPNEAIAFTVKLATGSSTAEWYNVTTREAVKGGSIKGERDTPQSFTPPFAAPAVLYLKATDR